MELQYIGWQRSDKTPSITRKGHVTFKLPAKVYARVNSFVEVQRRNGGKLQIQNLMGAVSAMKQESLYSSATSTALCSENDLNSSRKIRVPNSVYEISVFSDTITSIFNSLT